MGVFNLGIISCGQAMKAAETQLEVSWALSGGGRGISRLLAKSQSQNRFTPSGFFVAALQKQTQRQQTVELFSSGPFPLLPSF